MEIKRTGPPIVPQEISESQKIIEQSLKGVGSSQDEIVPFQADPFSSEMLPVDSRLAEAKDLLTEILSASRDSSKPVSSEETVRLTELKGRLSQILTSEVEKGKLLGGVEDFLDQFRNQLESLFPGISNDLFRDGSFSPGGGLFGPPETTNQQPAESKPLVSVEAERTSQIKQTLEDSLAATNGIPIASERAKEISEVQELLSQILIHRLKEPSDQITSERTAQLEETKALLTEILTATLESLPNQLTSVRSVQLQEVKANLSQILSSRLRGEELIDSLNGIGGSVDQLIDHLQSMFDQSRNPGDTFRDRSASLGDVLFGTSDTSTSEQSAQSKPVVTVEAERTARIKELLGKILKNGL